MTRRTTVRSIRRRTRQPVRNIIDTNTHAPESVNAKRRTYERVRKATNSHRNPYAHHHGPTNASHGHMQTHNLDSIARVNPFAHDDHMLATFLLENCVDDIRDMIHSTDRVVTQPAPCPHTHLQEDQTNGTDICTACGVCFQRLHYDTSWVDGFLEGTSSTVPRHLYKRKTYFLSHLRNLFSQSRARPAPWLVVHWARAQHPVSPTHLLDRMKHAPRSVRTAYRLPHYYRLVHSIYYTATRTRSPTMRSDMEDRIMHMYDGCLTAFVQVRKAHNRSSFPNKYYVMRQLLRLVHAPDAILDMVPVMCMQRKVREHDTLWQDICRIHHWPFQPLAKPHIHTH